MNFCKFDDRKIFQMISACLEYYDSAMRCMRKFGYNSMSIEHGRVIFEFWVGFSGKPKFLGLRVTGNFSGGHRKFENVVLVL